MKVKFYTRRTIENFEENDKAVSYYAEWMRAMREQHDFVEEERDADIIVYGQDWLTRFSVEEYMHETTVDKPKILMLNKEHEMPKMKMQFIKDKNIDLVFTLLTKDKWEKAEGITGTKFIHFHHGVNTDFFKPLDIKPLYDISFMGRITFPFWGDIPERHMIKKYLSKRVNTKGDIVANWVEDPKQFLYGEDYVHAINNAKINISTTSVLDILSERHFEIMSCGRLLLCNESTQYDGIFDERHAVMINNVAELDKRINYYLEHDDEREKKAKAGRELMLNYTWEKRVKDWTRIVEEELNL